MNTVSFSLKNSCKKCKICKTSWLITHPSPLHPAGKQCVTRNWCRVQRVFDLFCNIFFRKFLQYWNPEPPKNPSLLPQNRFKCFRRTFIPPRQKLALYGALKRAVKILWILLPSKCRYKYINNQSFSLASTDLERVGLTILQILQILQAETRQGVSWLYNYIISIITLIQL